MKILTFGLITRLYALMAGLVLFAISPCRADLTELEIDSSNSAAATESEYTLYPDISRQQSDFGHQALQAAYSGFPKTAHKILNDMRDLESAERLPPLSYLITIAIDVMRYQHRDFEDEEEEKTLLASIERMADQGRYLCKSFLRNEPKHPTYLLIEGGIRGFLATLKIHTNPSQALNDGFQALKLLERAHDLDPRIRDTFMGTGIFNCTAANAPLFVRATLKIIGRSVNMKTGLEGLRISAYQGQYTSVASQLYLIQFLSPYAEELKREKLEIFKTLESTFFKNPYYTFLKNDEALCFYPDTFFTKANRQELAARIGAFRIQEFSSRRYANLVRYQYTLLSPSPGKRLSPDSTFEFRDFEYYPVFIEALRFKHQTLDTLGEEESPPPETMARLKDYRDSCRTLLENSPMNTTLKRYYQWHITDALRWNARKSGNQPQVGSTPSQ